MLRRFSCAVWKLAPEEEFMLEGARAGIDGCCLGKFLRIGYLAVVSIVLEDYSQGG